MIHTELEPVDDVYYYGDDTYDQYSQQFDQSSVAALEKTRMCVYFLQGKCRYDTNCTYAHSAEELKQAPSNLRKTKFCDLFMLGHCSDPECNFAHSTEELKPKPRRQPSAGPIVLSSDSPSSSPINTENRIASTEACARTILSMLIKMEPDVAVSFLSNPDCRNMMNQFLTPECDEEDVSMITPQITPSVSEIGRFDDFYVQSPPPLMGERKSPLRISMDS